MSAFAGFARTLCRVALYPPLALTAFGDYLFSGASASLRTRIQWLRRVARLHAKWLGMRVRVHGPVPTSGLIVANHLGYLDIVGLANAGEFSFISKHEVAAWPVFGAYARKGGTIFVNREQRSSVADVVTQMREHVAAGVPIVFFPEGTSTGGNTVLPFRSSLFEPVVQLGCPIAACGLRYSLPGGSVADEVAYWRDMSFGPHLFNLLRKTGLTLDVHFGPSHHRTSDRKALSREMHTEVRTLAGLPEPAKK
jgi:1-acyl-sn-glycerol-3-phosphate acyltransferase